jgi:hypothetical protein
MSRRIVSVLLLAVMSLTGCSRFSSGTSAPRPLVVVLFDVSRSTRDPSIRERYRATFAQVVDFVSAQHGTVVGDVIDADPLAHSTFPIDATFDACNPLTENRLTCEARATQLRDHVLAEADAILGEVPVGAGTDIHDGISLAGRVFDAYPEATSRSLVLLSDMVEHSERVHGSADPGAVVGGLAADGLIPNLRGVTVYVSGAGVTSNPGPSQGFLATQAFWQAYFEHAGTVLSGMHYGAALVRFP